MEKIMAMLPGAALVVAGVIFIALASLNVLPQATYVTMGGGIMILVGVYMAVRGIAKTL